ncbi:MAG: 2-C-methyl-D-erythritol 4-phosphate cytidylyltransferase [Dysgonamonadaceae bacterium]|jgi:2-C-methyl-D-erythritol 4-phosphate cytidylyltransferase|nr:2-C-methyl-D-erythritol 4-phosphate cytidylyltransferase [Dysgonamonadaceae bacterium]
MNTAVMQKYVIIVAGGKGYRMKSNLPKQFMPLCGKPVLMHTIEAFYNCDPEISIILVLPEDHQISWNNLCSDSEFSIPHQTVTGGETRTQSVKNGIEHIEKELSAENREALIGIHDGVRPLVDSELITKVYQRAEFLNGAYPAMPVTESIRKLTGKKLVSVDRTKYFLVQTPQVFRSDILFKASHRDSQIDYTDDVSFVEATGICTPVMVEGSRTNIKITTPLDLAIATVLMSQT